MVYNQMKHLIKIVMIFNQHYKKSWFFILKIQ